MKNILLATTALVMTAGFASAEVTWSGSATAGIAREGKVAAGTAPTAAAAKLSALYGATGGPATADAAIDAILDVQLGSGTYTTADLTTTNIGLVADYVLVKQGIYDTALLLAGGDLTLTAVVNAQTVLTKALESKKQFLHWLAQLLKLSAT